MGLLYDGTNDNSIVGNTPSLTLTPPFTLDGRFAITNPVSNRFLLGANMYSAPSSFSVRWWGTGQGWHPGQMLAYLEDADGDAVFCYTATISTPGDRHHVAVTLSAGGELSLYVDGVFQSSSTNANVDPVDVGNDWYLGSESGGGYWLDGELDDWAKWDRVLSAGEIAARAAGASAMRFREALAWWMPGHVGADAFEQTDSGIWRRLDTTDNTSGVTDGPTVERARVGLTILQPVLAM